MPVPIFPKSFKSKNKSVKVNEKKINFIKKKNIFAHNRCCISTNPFHLLAQTTSFDCM